MTRNAALRGICVASIIALTLLSTARVFAEQGEDEKRRDVLKYGLEDEVTSLVKSLTTDKDASYAVELEGLFRTTKSAAIREAILSYFTAQKNGALSDYALKVLDDPYDVKSSTVQAIFAYVAELRLKEALPAVRKILKSENSLYRDKSISLLGKLGEAEDALFLVEYLDGEIDGEEKERLVIRQNVMAALGELKAVETWDRLVEIARDSDENANIRATAAVAVGKMEKPEAIPILSSLFEDSDPALRAAAVSGLSNFTATEATSVIFEGFKDSYYKVRLESIAASEKRRLPESIPYLLYRAKSDPVEDVRMKAYDALGALNVDEGNSWLKGVAIDEKASDKARVKAISVLAKNNFDYAFDDIERTATQALKDDKKTYLRYEIGKILASIANARTVAIASAYLAHKDVLTKSIGLDMYALNRYPEITPVVEKIAADEKLGTIQRRAKKILDSR